MFVGYNQRAMYIPYAAYIIFSISLFIFKGKTDFSSIFLWYLLLSNVAMTYITFRKKFSRHSHGYCMTFSMLMLITLFSAECHCSGSMQMIFFIIVCINSLYNSIGINLFEIIYITLLYLSYLIFAQSELMITAGSVGWLYIRFAMLYIGFALITLIIVLQKKIIRDAAERNEVARKATRVKSNFLANMSHEIRTPMNAVLGMVELALRCDMSEEAREYVRNIRSAGKNLLDIICAIQRKCCSCILINSFRLIVSICIILFIIIQNILNVNTFILNILNFLFCTNRRWFFEHFA